MNMCYIVVLRPFKPEERKSEAAKECEKKSLEEGICGMGWNENSELWEKGISNIDDNSIEYHSQNYGKGWKTAVNIYKKMQPGDYVLTRDYNGKCYVGMIKSKAYHEEGILRFDNYDNYSWIVKVDWKPVGDFINLPGGLRGLMSGRISTAKRVYGEVHKKLIEYLYAGTAEKIKLEKENFCEALSPDELEDIVALYINIKNPDFMMIPSSCKSSEPKYEFKLVNKRNSNDCITCQVKNNKKLIAKEYESSEFSKIYLFSGKEEYGECSNIASNIEIIEKESLFKLIKEYYTNGFLKKQMRDIYKF